MIIQSIVERIQQRRLQMILHSQAYYRYDFTIVSDLQFDKWAKELVDMQQQHSSESENASYNKEFVGFDGTTGYHLLDIEPKRFMNKLYYILIEIKRSEELTAEQIDFLDCVVRGVY